MKKLGISVALSMVAMIFLSMMPIMPVKAAEEIYMTPAANPPAPGPSLGFKWNITIWVKDYDNPNVFAWQAKLVYNGVGAKINATRAWNAAFDPLYIFTGRAVVGTPPVIVPQVSVLMGDSLLGGNAETTPPNPAKLAIVEFEILGAPAKYETLSTALSFVDADTFLLDESLASRTPILTGGTYSWVWSPPTTQPQLEVVPSLVEMNAEPFNVPVIGSTFNVAIRLRDLDVGWAITSAAFRLSFNPAIIDIVGGAGDVTINAASWDGPSALVFGPGTVDITVSTTQSLAGDVLVATIKFTVMNQLLSPPNPAPPGSPRGTGQLVSALDLSNEALVDHIGPIPNDPSVDGKVIVFNLQALPLAWLSVEPPSTTLGPELVIGQQFGKTFTVGVKMNKLHSGWKTIGVQFRLSYDPTLLQVLSIDEGPYMAQFAPYGTWFYGNVEPPDLVYPQHVLVGILILPNGTGHWNTWAGWDPVTHAKASGILATITFKPLKQSWVTTYTDTLDILENMATDTGAGDVPLAAPVDGTVTILPIAPAGRVIDVWMFDPAFGGEGAGMPADLVLPQMGLNLTAKVTYNWQPVSYKKVTFEIRNMDTGQLWAVLQDDTDDFGHAYVFFRMPWTGQGAEANLGKWRITVSVTLADVVITDYMDFDYDYLIRITSVTTNKLEYYKSNDVIVTVNYKSKVKRAETVTMYVTIQDELGVPIGIASKTRVISGGAFCTYKTYTDTVTIHVPRWAYAGQATVRVSFVWGLPSEGGEAVAQEVTAIIWILPIHFDDPWLIDP